MKKCNLNLVFRLSLVLFTMMLSTQALRAQLTGTKTIPTDYATIAAFVTDLNAQGVGPGGVTLNVPAGHTETAAGTITVTATGTAANPIIIQKSGAGLNPVITSYTTGTGTPGTAVQDGIFALVGSDYVTINGINLTENAANTTNPATMEYGYGMFKASVTDGCQNNTIQNCVVTLSNVNNAGGTSPAVDGSRGINVVNSLITTQTTSMTPTSAAGSNSNNRFYSNTINNTNVGISIIGFAASTPFTLADTGNDIGGASAGTGNTVTNFGGAAAATNPSAGIRTLAQYNLNVSYNSLNNNNGSGANHVSTLRGIFINTATSANATINNNTVVLHSGATTSLMTGIDNQSGGTAASNTININNNLLQLGYNSATTGVVSGIVNGATAATVNINGNTIEGIAATNLNGTGTHVMIETGSPTTANANNNIIRNLTRAGASGNWRGLKTTNPTNFNASGNLIENLSWTAAASTGGIDGIYSLSSAVNVSWTNNIVRNLSTPTTGTINGLREFGVAGNKIISNNQVYGFSTTAGGVGGATFNGIFTSTGAITISNNVVYSLNSTGTTGGTGGVINGINVSGGTAAQVFANKIYDLSSTSTGVLVSGIVQSGNAAAATYNNAISDLRASAANGADMIRGINISSTSGSTAYGVYYNTIYLSATSSGANFGTSGIFHAASGTATQATLDMRNNIVINQSTPNGTGVTAAYRRSGTALANFAATSNRNLLFAGTPSATRALMFDGTTPYQTLATYVPLVAPRETNSFTGEAFAYGTPGSFFISLTGSSSDFLRPVPGILTQVESGGVNITTPAITTDFSAAIRAGNAGYVGAGTAPDLGAYEFAGTTPAPVITLNSVTPPASTSCTAAPRLISVNVSTASGTTSTVNIVYTVNGAAQAPIAMTNTSGTTWEGTIPVPTPVNATIAWAVVAQSSLGLNGSYTGTPYADEPLLGATATASASSATVCSGTSTNLTAVLRAPGGTVQVGTATSTTSTAGITPFNSNWEGSRTQYLVRASELQALGMNPGNITALSFIVTASGAGTFAQSNFSIKMAHTAQTTMASAYGTPTGAFTTVYTAATEPAPAVGVKTYLFTAPFTWDGTSNILVDICHDNDLSSTCASCFSSSSTVQYSVTGYNSVWGSYADNVQSCGTQAANTITTFNNRPNMIFRGIAPVAAGVSVTWMDGATTVGTGNPQAVSPVSTTTYTSNISYQGCAFSPSPTVTVTTIALPSAPTATNSGQCGAQVPTASVTSTTGLPTPTFNWYAAASGGSPLQSGTSNTYTSVVSTTTTFYVSELNTGTGCESARTAVLVNVSSADPIAAVAAPTSVCLGQSFTLTASNTAGTPFQNYSYSFQSVTTGSGAETPVAGNPVTITPTASGTFVYTVNGVDGGCAATNTVSVVVKALPVLTATATPATVCSGDPIALSLTSSDYTSGATVQIGTQTTTEFGGGVYRNGFGTGDFRHQLIFTAAELTAAGIQPGNITALNFYVTAVGSGSANNYTIRMGNTAATTATTTFLAAPGTTVYTAATYTAVNGTNTHTFSTPFNWDGTSNVLIDICYNISTIGGSSTLAATTPAVTRNSNLLGSAGACSAATGTTFANRPLVGFTGNAVASINGTATITWAPGGFTTPTASTSVTNNTGAPITQAYTVNVMNPATGCSNTATTAAVTINPATVAPIANNSTQCGSGVPTASVTGSGAPGNTFQWFTVPTGGTAIAGQTGNSLSGYTVTTTTTFYVSEYNGSCASPRTAVTVTVTTPPAVSIAGSTNLCIGSSESLTASSPNDPNYTYSWSGGLGTGATVTAAPTVNTTYTVTATDASGGANNGCVTTAAISITVNPVPTGVTASASDNTICNGESVTLTSTPASAPVNLLSQTFTGGFGTWTTTYSGTAPVATQWLVQNAPYTYTGSMTFSNFTTPQGGGFAMTNGDLGSSGLRTRAALNTPSFSTVGMNSATLTFQNLYQRWASGDSAVIVQASVNGGTTWTTVKEYFALAVNQGDVTNNAQVMANESITLAPGLMNQPDVRLRFYYVSSWGYYWAIDNVQLTGTPAPLTYAWTSSPAGYSASVQNPPAPVAPTTTTTYTMTATNSFGCTASASTTVTVNQPTTSSTSVTACETYTWTNGTTYNTSGTYTQTLTNANGCDSVATLVLTINNATTSTTSMTACDSYTWTNGTTYNTSGTYTQMLTNANGCDSVATLVLTINNSTTSSTSVTACNSYTWTNGTTYNTSGTYTQTLTNAAGCDSVATLVLTITTTVTSSTPITACDSYTWTDGTTYTASGTYTQTLTSTQGCDSIATLVLTINNSTTSSTAITACETYTWTDGTTYTASGTYTQTLTNAVGCDSIATLVLTINNATSSTTTASACEEYTWTDGVTYTTSGTYTQALTNANGCDSTAILVLTINSNPTATATDNGDATITASAGTSYQWVHCATGLPIAGATSQTYTATVNGDYAVVVTNASGCSDTSNCVTIDNIGIKELTDASIKVFPNPTNGDVYVTMTAASATIDVVDAQGKLLQTVTVQNGEKVQLSAYETGVYFLRIETENGSAVERIVKN